MKTLNLHSMMETSRGLVSRRSSQSFVGSRFRFVFENLGKIVATLLLFLTIGMGNAWGETVTFKQGSTNVTSLTASSGTMPTNGSASFKTTYSNAQQLTNSNTQTLTLKDWCTTKITNITLSMRSNKSDGAGKLRYSTDGGSTWNYVIGSENSGVAFNNTAWNGSYTTTYTSISKNVAIQGVKDKNIVIEIVSTKNSIYCQSYSITYTYGSCSTGDCDATPTIGAAQINGSVNVNQACI